MDSVTRLEEATLAVSSPPPDTLTEGEINFGRKFEDPRIVALNRWGRGSNLKQWAKPAIVSDEPRNFAEFPAESGDERSIYKDFRRRTHA
jgi:hypothetical protein